MRIQHPKRVGGTAPQFSDHVCCGQTAGLITMPLGTMAYIGPGNIVLDADPASAPPRGTVPPIFSPCMLWPNGWMDRDATWCEGMPPPRPHCVTWGPSSPPKGEQPPIFGSCLLWLNGRPCQLLLSTFHSSRQRVPALYNGR